MVRIRIQFLLGGNIVETFCPQKISALHPSVSFRQPESRIQFRMRIIGGKTIIFCTALRVKSIGYCDGFQQRGFSASVFSHKESNRMREFHTFHALQRFNIPQIAVLFYFAPVNGKPLNQLIVHVRTSPFCPSFTAVFQPLPSVNHSGKSPVQ